MTTTGTPTTEEQKAAIRAAYEANGDTWWPELDPILDQPDIATAYVQFAQVTAAKGALEPKLRELLLLAVNASTTTLHLPSVERHIREALRHGATREELVEVFEVVSVLGIHSAHTGLPLLRDVLQEQNLLPSQQLDDRQAEIKQRYIAGRGMWGEALEAMLLLDPELVDAYLQFSSVPWIKGALSPVVKELIYIAIDASITHLFNEGTRAHIVRALEAGATTDQIAGVLALISTIGAHSLTAGLRILHELTD
jgi:alkylhydroperoxidase/carboxymuconolactone decarboxylase family protein YurZ